MRPRAGAPGGGGGRGGKKGGKAAPRGRAGKRGPRKRGEIAYEVGAAIFPGAEMGYGGCGVPWGPLWEEKSRAGPGPFLPAGADEMRQKRWLG